VGTLVRKYEHFQFKGKKTAEKNAGQETSRNKYMGATSRKQCAAGLDHLKGTCLEPLLHPYWVHGWDKSFRVQTRWKI